MDIHYPEIHYQKEGGGIKVTACYGEDGCIYLPELIEGIPVTAIGGVSTRTLPSLAGTGVAGAAVVSAIFAAEDIEAATRELRRLAEGAVESR